MDLDCDDELPDYEDCDSDNPPPQGDPMDASGGTNDDGHDFQPPDMMDTSDAGSDDPGCSGNDSGSDGYVPQQAQAGRGRDQARGRRRAGRPRGGGVNIARMQRDRWANVMTDLHMAEPYWVDANNTAPVVHPFRTAAEVLVDTTDFKAVDYFKLYLDDDLLNHIVTQTNKYAHDYIHNPPTPLKRKSRVHDWIPTNAEEMQTFLGLAMLMGIIHKPSIALYWSTDTL